ncbi:T9SS type A sorting domain-containing protein [bacterium]|nr:T9SS type A sorting domain-containing protein [bacterium]
MIRIISSITAAVLTFSIPLHSQDTPVFSLRTRNLDYGYGTAVFTLDDTTIFLANGYKGLSVYRIVGSEAHLTANVCPGSFILDVCVAPDGTVLCASGVDGLYAFSYTSAELLPLAHISVEGLVYNVTVMDDGTILLANGVWGIKAYRFEYNEFREVASYYTNMDACDIAVGPDDSIYVANGRYGFCGLRLHDNLFSPVTRVNDLDAEQYERAEGLAISPEGYLFLACQNAGLLAYERFGDELVLNYKGDETFGRHVRLTPDSLIFLTGWADRRLAVYRYADTVVQRINIYNLDHPIEDVAVGSNTMLFTAEPYNGLGMYRYSDSSIVPVYHTNDSGSAQDLAINSQGIIFLANQDAGLRAYRLTETGLVCLAHVRKERVSDVAVLADSLVLVADLQYGMTEYIFDGYAFTEVFSKNGGFDHTMIDSAGNVLAASGFNVQVYSCNNIGLILLSEYEIGHCISDIAAGPAGTIVTAHEGGLSIIERDGLSVTNVITIDDGYVRACYVDQYGTIFSANSMGFLRAYHYLGGEVVPAGSIKLAGLPTDIRGNSQGVLFISNLNGGLWACSWDGSAFCQTGFERSIGYNGVAVEVLADSIVFFANGAAGLFVYDYSGPNPSSTIEERDTGPLYVLNQNYPNPFNSCTTIMYTLERAGTVTINVYNILGQNVKTLFDGFQQAGEHRAVFDASGFSSGIYFYMLYQGEDKIAQKKMVILK